VNHLLIALIVFACVFGSALAGVALRAVLPQHHLGDESVGVVKLTTGLIATLAALVLGLLISSAKSSFDAVNNELIHNAASIVQLDRVLARYGPQTQQVRVLIKQSFGESIRILGSADAAQLKRLGSLEAIRRTEDLQRRRFTARVARKRNPDCRSGVGRALAGAASGAGFHSNTVAGDTSVVVVRHIRRLWSVRASQRDRGRSAIFRCAVHLCRHFPDPRIEHTARWDIHGLAGADARCACHARPVTAVDFANG
jgi:hypothetical protein